MDMMTGDRNGLLQKLGGDLTAAALSTVLISPTVTIIDRYVIKNNTSDKHAADMQQSLG
jgi:uncharacterized protein (UPF0218 family)